MSLYIQKFCNTLDTNYLKKLSVKEQKDVKNILLALNNYVNNIDKLKKHLYYMLITFLEPIRTIDINPKIIQKLSIKNFCKTFLENNFIEYCYKLKYTCYNEAVIKGISPNLDNFSKKEMDTLFKIIDKTYFNNLLTNLINSDKSIELSFLTTKAYKKTGGYCEMKKDYKKCYYKIALAPKIPIIAFTKHKYQNSNSILKYCFNPLDCIIDVMSHEIVHFIIFALCPYYDVPGGHSEEFKKIIYNMFGHTNFRHSIGRTPDREPIKTIFTKDKIIEENAKYIYFKHDKNSEELLKEEIIKLNPKKVKTRNYLVPYQLILKIE